MWCDHDFEFPLPIVLYTGSNVKGKKISLMKFRLSPKYSFVFTIFSLEGKGQCLNNYGETKSGVEFRLTRNKSNSIDCSFK